LADQATRVQVCGRLAVEIEGRRVEDELPGRQGRLLVVYLVLNRDRAADRDELADAIWSDRPPSAPASALRALLSKLRPLLAPAAIEGRGEVRLRLPRGAFVDIEAARASIHRAESALAQGEWGAAWGPAQVALFTARRGLLPGEEADWVAERRRELEEIHERALEAYGRACLGVGGTELDAAVRAGRGLAASNPYRESGHALLIEALARQGNTAEALRAYEDLRARLGAELGIAPSPDLRALHERLLAATR
jgi:DNA-binding SARP family transcriptional activator